MTLPPRCPPRSSTIGSYSPRFRRPHASRLRLWLAIPSPRGRPPRPRGLGPFPPPSSVAPPPSAPAAPPGVPRVLSSLVPAHFGTPAPLLPRAPPPYYPPPRQWARSER